MSKPRQVPLNLTTFEELASGWKDLNGKVLVIGVYGDDGRDCYVQGRDVIDGTVYVLLTKKSQE